MAYDKFLLHEYVVSGSANGTLQYYNSANGHIVINNITGEFNAGDTVTGVESGFSAVLPAFAIHDEMAAFDYDQTSWVVADGAIGIDDHFTGLPSQDYQVDHIVVADDS